MLTCGQCVTLDECGGHSEAQACESFDRKDGHVAEPINPVAAFSKRLAAMQEQIDALERAFSKFVSDIRNATMGGER